MTLLDSSLLRSEHLPLRGLYLARRNAVAGRMPRFQLVPARPVRLPDGTTSTLVTEFGWISDIPPSRGRRAAYADGLSARLLDEAGAEYMGNIYCEALPVRLDQDGMLHNARRRQGEEGPVAPPPELQPGLKVRLQIILRKRLRQTPWLMKPRRRIEFAIGAARLERALQAIWNHCPHQEGETVHIDFKPEDLGTQHWNAFWFGDLNPAFKPFPMVIKPKHNTAWKEAMSLVTTAFLGTAQALAAVKLVGGAPTAHQAIEDAVVLEPFRLTPEMIADGKLPS